ncbi:Glycosyltransferase, catalytic subunit of cellulose synthase and poly-beta-1,6-N-acetylglucosamine synthase [Sphingomonas palmae]|uniref:Glycosyltransferase, catalytic subunit of cellulose synthase and poly-beta-1,6-N-acetylglucosamine synthase n=1 Tax=Sphingomonas palmae TaxID=1855283 RepID=A0A1H7U4L9_9SPHN|nr:glycosyltransferase [Sphingomonas palmae]SEL91656.1 Glycosyltransferase, catalytic subunit of cellulose synthase and poly-beta-1,6-N-acetylglucosamine synthase [Sphingomonas palmae]
MQTAAWILLILPIAVFLGYPALVLVAASLRGPRERPSAETPPLSITILICAHNEARTLGEKLASVNRALSAWPHDAQLLVADDGSTDDTVAIARARGAEVVVAPRGGKAAALNLAMRHARGEVIVMTDADPLFDDQTLPALLAPFADPEIGAVAGRVETLRARRTARFAGADRLFRSYESSLRLAEDRLFGCISADGGLYAIRRALVPHVVADATDDFFVSTAAVAAGHRIAFAGDARVWEHSIAGSRQQFRRRVRITVRGLTGLWRRRALMNPWRTGWYAPALFLHKVARRLVPLTLLPLWLLSGALAVAGSGWWLLVFAALTAAASIATAGALGVRLIGPLRIVSGAMLHLAGLALGTLLFLGGRRYAQWTPQKDAA